jgi:RNA recognition motif-containing protein
MSKSLYVGNLPWSAKEEELTELFSAHGQVESVRLIIDKQTGRSRGFAFVDVADGDVEKILSALNGYKLDGRDLRVNEAQPKQRSSRPPMRRDRF